MNYSTFKEDLENSFNIINDDIDISFLIELLYYFPIDQTYISTGSYDQYLFDLEKTVIDNYQTGNYQVSYFYAHLIFMSFVYYSVERLYRAFPERTKDVYYPINAYRSKNEEGKKLGKPDLDNYDKVYDFSTIPEKDIFKIFYAAGLPNETIKNLGKYINSRDDYAHATGKGNISEQEFLSNIKTVKGNMKTIHDLFSDYIKAIYCKFIVEYLQDDYELLQDRFNNFIFDNSLSIFDVEILCQMSIKKIEESDEVLLTEYQSTRNIHCAFIEYCMENDGIDPPDGYEQLRNDNYLLFRYKDHAKEFIENELHISEYECVKDGDTFPLYECPNCENEQLAYDANDKNYICFSCGQRFDDLIFCCECGKPFCPQDDEIICPDCWREKLEKD